MSATQEEWRAQYERCQRFAATELGKLYQAYEHALIDYWRHDAVESVSDSKLKSLDERAREATHAFVIKLMEIAGV